MLLPPFTNVSPQTLENLKTRLSLTHQANLSTSLSDPNGGHILGHGVAADYTYDPAGHTLTIDVKHHPFFVPLSMIERSLRDAIADSTPESEKAA